MFDRALLDQLSYLVHPRPFVIKAIRDPKARELVVADFIPIKSSRIGELAAKFDIVMGYTAEG